jgi:hypothetical protein
MHMHPEPAKPGLPDAVSAVDQMNGLLAAIGIFQSLTT